jgi:hypothetical protein
MTRRFEAIPRIDGGEVFDQVLQRTVDVMPSVFSAQREAKRLNALVAGASRKQAARALAHEVLELAS